MIKLDMLIKKSKSLKNWFTVKFKKHPYLYSVLLGWIIFIVPGLYGFYKSWGNTTGALVVSILILLNFVILLLWFQKNKSKIKPFYKRNKKIFNRVYFYLGSVFSLVPIGCLIGIIATGGVNNFIERTKFEIKAAVHTYNDYDLCSSPSILFYTGFPKANRLFFFKEGTQYIDYFENKFPSLILKDNDLLNLNHCTSTRFLLKEAHKGNEIAKEMLVAYPPELKEIYSFPSNHNDKYIFSRYEKNIENMDLNNPAIAYSYAIHLDDTFSGGYWRSNKNKPLNVKPEALKYLKQSAEDGYFFAMADLISIYADKNYINQVNCNNYLKYTNALADEKSLMPYYILMNGYMGRSIHLHSKTVVKCLNNKPNFSKSFSMLTKRPTAGSTSTYQSKKSHNFNSSYPAIYYLYGLGDVKQDYAKAYELFSYSEDNAGFSGIPDQAYLAYMNYMGMGVEQNPNKGKGLAIELAKNIPITKTQKNSWGQTLLCGDVSYNFIISDLLNSESYWMKKNYSQLSKYNKKKIIKEHEANEKIDKKVKKKYRDKLGQCLFKSEPEVSIKFLKDYIYNRMNDWFKNPELVKTLNYLGEPK